MNFKVVQISIDGLEGTHNDIRLNNLSFKKALKGISLLSKNNVDVAMSCLPTNKNLSEIEELCDLLSNLGIKIFRMQPFMNMGRGENIYDGYSLSYDQETKLISIIKKLKLKHGNLNIEWGDPSDHLYHMRTIKSYNEILPEIFVSALGEIGLTPYLLFSLGNIKNHNLHDIVTEKNLDKFINNRDVQNVLNKVNSAKDFKYLSEDTKSLSENNHIIL